MTQKSLLTLAFSTLLLAACTSSGTNTTTSQTTTSNIQNSARPALESKSIDKAMRKALAQAEASGDAQQVIATLAQINARNPDDSIIATRYARALREDDQINKAQRTLQPFVNAEKPNVEALTEMAMTQLALGDYKSAKNYALKSTVIAPKNARGYLALGTAQDALKDHANAEQSFRQGLKYWKGDPSPILNNLALNLASQGHLKESLSLLERALRISPRRMELERNRRIIATLLETSGPIPPAPYKKPDIVIPESAKPVEKVAKKTPPKKPAPVKAESKKSVEHKTEKTAPKEKMDVNVNGVTSIKVKTNIKLKSNVTNVND